MKLLIKHIEVKGILQAVTGLRIGAGGAGIEIGGLDNPILRHPETRVPYVPGSSLKGKLRSLLEVNGYKIGQRHNRKVARANATDASFVGFSAVETRKALQNPLALFSAIAPFVRKTRIE
jgi:CRISPR-associated protein Csm3